MGVFDAHAHVRLDSASRSALLAAMDEAEIAKTIVVGGGLISVEELSARLSRPDHAIECIHDGFDNDNLLGLCRESNDRLLPFYFCNPSADVENYNQTGAAFAGLKLAPAVHGFLFHQAQLDPILRAAARFGHAVYTHCLPRPGVDVKDLADLANLYPDITFILGHAGVHVLDLDAIATIRPAANLLFETSGGYRFAIEWAVEQLGGERVVFGSEYPLQDPYVELCKIRRLRVAPDIIDKISGRNIQRCVGAL